MSSGLFKKVICKNMFKRDLALNDLEGLICHQIMPQVNNCQVFSQLFDSRSQIWSVFLVNQKRLFKTALLFNQS